MFNALLKNRLAIPVIAAPLFLASDPALVIACCKAGVVGSLPSLNQRDGAGFEAWLVEIETALAKHEKDTGKKPAPYGVNLIVRETNKRLEEDLTICIKHKVPIIMTIMGVSPPLIKAVHDYGGVILHDVPNIKFARKAAEAGVDCLMALAAGAGGHTGWVNSFALVNEIKQFFNGPVVLGGGISTGSDIAAAQMMGAEYAYMGTRFLATREAGIAQGYKDMLVASTAADIVTTPAVSGVNANFMLASLREAGIDPTAGAAARKLEDDLDSAKQEGGEKKAWRDIWSAGHGVGSINDLPTTAELVARMRDEYIAAHKAQNARAAEWL